MRRSEFHFQLWNIYVIDDVEKYIIYWIHINHLKNYINTNYNKMKIGKTKSIDSNGNFNGMM